MEIWWTSLDMFLKVMWVIAIVTSVVFVIQMTLTFVGMDADGDISGDVPNDTDSGETPFQLFTFRSFINFFLGFSWTGIAFYGVIGNKLWLTLFAAFMGVLLVALVMLLFYALSRTVQSGNINIRQAVGLTAIVYFPVAAARVRAGKIQVTVQQAVREYDAMTDGAEIATGRLVRITDVIEGNILLVENA
jgi:membrane protein implicated in regulation of membrane protease activity